MITRYIYRLDDISPDMNYVNFVRIRDLFFKYEIKPIIGVIPHNEDQKLVKQAGSNRVDEVKFWEEIRDLQANHGWAIALHGYNHVYITSDSGILRVNKRAEFAGISYEEQNAKIRNGVEIFRDQNVDIDAFMAPAHSFDWNTVLALKNNGINVITDGHRRFPYYKHDMLFIPQMLSWPEKKRVGVQTVCLHINEWDDKRFDLFENKIQYMIGQNTDFLTVVKEAYSHGVKQYAFANGCFVMIDAIDYYIRVCINKAPFIKKVIKRILRMS